MCQIGFEYYEILDSVLDAKGNLLKIAMKQSAVIWNCMFYLFKY